MNAVENALMDFSTVTLKEAFFLDFSIERGNKQKGGIERSVITGFACDASVSQNFNTNEKEVQIIVDVKCEALNEDSNKEGVQGNFKLVFTFFIENMEDHLVKIPSIEGPVPSPALVVPLVGAAYSTARGMILVKVLGTSLEGFSLPITNVRDLFKSPKATPKKKATKKSKD